jgi:hypothetical protein
MTSYYFKSPIPIDRQCKACNLSTNFSVSGNGPQDLTAVKLIVVSDYPGAYETEFDFPQVPNDWAFSQRKRSAKFTKPNSGRFIRDILSQEYGLDDREQIWFTNALKCDPSHNGRKAAINGKHLQTCTRNWLQVEFDLLNQAAPKAALLIAGARALEALRLLYPDIPGTTVSSLLRSSFFCGSHAAVCTYNPASYARSISYIESNVVIDYRTKLKTIVDRVPLNKYCYTPVEVFKEDLKPLKQFLLS